MKITDTDMFGNPTRQANQEEELYIVAWEAIKEWVVMNADFLADKHFIVEDGMFDYRTFLAAHVSHTKDGDIIAHPYIEFGHTSNPINAYIFIDAPKGADTRGRTPIVIDSTSVHEIEITQRVMNIIKNVVDHWNQLKEDILKENAKTQNLMHFKA